jgi:lysophospholipase L1-like esterase
MSTNNEPPTIHVVGDSISIHYGPYLRQYLAGLVRYSRKGDGGGMLDDVHQSNGGDSAMVAGYLRQLRESGKRWDFLVVNCGLHDVKIDPKRGTRQVPADEYRTNVGTIADLGQSLAGRLIWVRTTPVDDQRHNRLNQEFQRYRRDVEDVNGIADAVMRKHGVPQIDLHAFTANVGGDLYCDHVHFTEPVRQAQAAYIAGYLSALIGR